MKRKREGHARFDAFYGVVIFAVFAVIVGGVFAEHFGRVEYAEIVAQARQGHAQPAPQAARAVQVAQAAVRK
jgi:hypothetical protein